MATQISANFRKLCPCTAYNKTLTIPHKFSLSLQYPSASNKTRAPHFNIGRVRERILGDGGLKWSKTDTTVWFVRGSKSTSSATLNISLENIAES